MLTRKNTHQFLAIISVVGVLAASFSNAFAKDTQWQKDHPRREQVNNRLEKQNDRIKKEVKEGDLIKAQAHKLVRKDQKIRQEERDMASQNGGHITKAEQKVLNQHENTVIKQIGK